MLVGDAFGKRFFLRHSTWPEWLVIRPSTLAEQKRLRVAALAQIHVYLSDAELDRLYAMLPKILRSAKSIDVSRVIELMRGGV